MTYNTEMADWTGQFIEQISDLVLNITPSFMLLLGIISVMSIFIIIYFWAKHNFSEVSR